MKNLNNIILIGPLATGKSSIAKELSNITGLVNYPVDKLKWYYRMRNGFDLAKCSELLKEKGFEAMLGYASRFFGPKELQTILESFNGIIDLGASDTHTSDLQRIQEIQEVLSPYRNKFLILPYEDDSLSEEILTRRLRLRYQFDDTKRPVLGTYIKKNHEYLYSKQNRMIANHVIYANDRSSNLIAQEIYYKSILWDNSPTSSIFNSLPA